MPDPFASRLDKYRERIEAVLDRAVPSVDCEPTRLHEAMRYAVLNGGKRIRPLLAYATAECLGVAAERIDAAAAAIELIHSFSLIHDDLPSMDDDDLRRGLPTVHRQFDEATAILAGDALLPLAFDLIATADSLTDPQRSQLVALIAGASGSLGMTGGQAIDLEAEGTTLSATELETLHNMKTGALIRAAIMCATCVRDAVDEPGDAALESFAGNIGLAFQIRDDVLDVEGETASIGKPAGSDQRLDKATWTSTFGVAAATEHCQRLLTEGRDSLHYFGDAAEPLCWLAGYIVDRES